jgi:hypothetical protein
VGETVSIYLEQTTYTSGEEIVERKYKYLENRLSIAVHTKKGLEKCPESVPIPIFRIFKSVHVGGFYGPALQWYLRMTTSARAPIRLSAHQSII